MRQKQHRNLETYAEHSLDMKLVAVITKTSPTIKAHTLIDTHIDLNVNLNYVHLPIIVHVVLLIVSHNSQGFYNCFIIRLCYFV